MFTRRISMFFHQIATDASSNRGGLVVPWSERVRFKCLLEYQDDWCLLPGHEGTVALGVGTAQPTDLCLVGAQKRWYRGLSCLQV